MIPDRRVSRRLMVCVPCRIKCEDRQIPGRSFDLSEGGAAIITDTELTPNETYDLELCWLQGEPSQLRGEVRYCRQLKDGTYMSGIRFDGAISGEGREILRGLRS